MSFDRGELGRAKKTFTLTSQFTTVLDPEIQGGDFVLCSLRTVNTTTERAVTISNLNQGVSFEAGAGASDVGNVYNYVIL